MAAGQEQGPLRARSGTGRNRYRVPGIALSRRSVPGSAQTSAGDGCKWPGFAASHALTETGLTEDARSGRGSAKLDRERKAGWDFDHWQPGAEPPPSQWSERRLQESSAV